VEYAGKAISNLIGLYGMLTGAGNAGIRLIYMKKLEKIHS
jgi:hypothetical protein